MTLFSSHWYRVGSLAPRLRSTATITRQVFRGEVWYVVLDELSGRVFRLTPSAHRIVGLMDGRRSVEQIWTLAAEHLGDDLPTQDEIIALMARLHQADLLITDTVPDLDEIGTRRKKRERQELTQKLKSPLAIRFPLFDPDRFLTRTLPWVAPLLSWTGLVVAMGLIVVAAIVAALSWGELSSNLLDRVTTYENVLLMLAVYPAIKACHELGHAYAVKRWGGEVHEIGVMLLIFFPVPYVDATASASWPSKWQRIAVSGMGILVELVLASLAIMVWASVETGIVSAVAFAVAVTGGVSTLLFNGNPLLRFDGYYVFSDLIEIPNLGQRANAYVGYLIKRYAFGVKEAKSPGSAPGEAGWMFTYAVSSFCYRIAVTFGIIVFVADHFFTLGTLLALLAFTQMVLLPVLKSAVHVAAGQELKKLRRRAVSVSLLAIVVVMGLLLVPLPYRGMVQGVVWVPDGARVVSESAGFIGEVAAKPGDKVGPGGEIMRLVNDELSARVTILKAQVAQFEARVAAEVRNGPASVAQARQQLDHAKAALEDALVRESELVVRAATAGAFVPLYDGEVRGRYVGKGQNLGYVLDRSQPTTVRLAVPEYEADLIRARGQGVELRLAERPGEVFPARIVREVPAARDSLPSKALSTEGGGPFYLDPREPDRLKSIEHVFVFECELAEHLPLDRVGGRVFARLDYGSAPALMQLYRPLRQLILKQLKI